MSKITEATRDHISEEKFAFPEERKEPIHDAEHVRNAIARFNQVKGVSDDERDAAWRRIKAAAKKHGVEVGEKSWHDLKAKEEAPLDLTSKEGAARADAARSERP